MIHTAHTSSLWQRAVHGLYSVLITLAVPLALVALKRRSHKIPGYRDHMAERLGFYKVQCEGCVWVHAVSVGEVRAAQPLVEALLKQQAAPVLVTTMTPTGRATAHELFGQRVAHATLCWDTPAAMGRFFAYFAPRAGIVMETEIWPNLMRTAQQRGVPMVLANARLSAKSLTKSQRLDALARPAYARFTKVLAQSQADAQRIRSMGARDVQAAGSIKFDVKLDAQQLMRGQQERASRAGITVLLASTRDGEEAMLLRSVAPMVLEDAGLSLMVVPRRPQRFDEVAGLLTQHALPFTRKSQGGKLDAQHRVLLGDTMGEMAYYFGCADIAIVGGGWLPHGGSNHIEACAAGCATLVGPHMFNFADALQKALDAGAIVQLQGASQLMVSLRELIDDADRRTHLSLAAFAFSTQHGGAAQRMLEAILPLIKEQD
jgi:3-deoxy-D-manno-octulosonic-acid transferase